MNIDKIYPQCYFMILKNIPLNKSFELLIFIEI